MHLPDPRSLPKIAIGSSLVLAPLAYLVSTLVAPPLVSGDAEKLAAMGRELNRTYVFGLLTIVGTILLVPAVVGVMQLLRDRSPWLGYIGGGLVELGMLIAIGDSFLVLVNWQMAKQAAGDRAQMAALSRSLDNAAGLNTLFTVGGLGIMAGSVLLGVGLLRSRVVPWWAAVAFPAGSIVNIVGFSMNSRSVLDASALLLLAALVPVAVKLYGLPHASEPTGAALSGTH
jgi:hypothetical protein